MACIFAGMASKTLIQEIKAFLSQTGMSAYRFGFLAARNGRLVERLERGGRVWPETEEAVRSFMAGKGIASHRGSASNGEAV